MMHWPFFPFRFLAANRRRTRGRMTQVFAFAVLAAGSARATCPPLYTQNFDAVAPPALPANWTASQGVNLAAAPPFVTSSVSPDTAPNDAFSSAPDNILDNRLDAPLTQVGID